MAGRVVGDLSIDYARRLVTLAGEPVELTNTEYAVPYQFAVQSPKALTRSLLLQRVWGPERGGEGSLLRNVVRKLRREQGDDAAKPWYIVTEPRVGYGMPEGEEPTPEHEQTWASRNDSESALSTGSAAPPESRPCSTP